MTERKGNLSKIGDLRWRPKSPSAQTVSAFAAKLGSLKERQSALSKNTAIRDDGGIRLLPV